MTSARVLARMCRGDGPYPVSEELRPSAPTTVAKRITGEGSEKGEELMTPIRTPGANSARREGR